MVFQINLRMSNITCAVVYIVLTGLYMIYIYIQMMAFCCANASVKNHKPSVHKTHLFSPFSSVISAMLRCLGLLCKLLCIILQLFLKAAQRTPIGTTPTTKRLETGNHPPRLQNGEKKGKKRAKKRGWNTNTPESKNQDTFSAPKNWNQSIDNTFQNLTMPKILLLHHQFRSSQIEHVLIDFREKNGRGII